MDEYGLMLYNARWCDPTIADFIQPNSLSPTMSRRPLSLLESGAQP